MWMTRPAGGGAGMVLRADVLGEAIEQTMARQFAGNWPLIYLSPRGRRMDQRMMQNLARCDGMTLLCGRFEGVDERVLEHYGVQEVSLGDFVMTGGEIAAQAADRRDGAADPWRSGQSGLSRGGELFLGPAGASAIHPPCRMEGPSDPGYPDVRPPWAHCQVAARDVGKDHPGTAPRFVGALC